MLHLATAPISSIINGLKFTEPRFMTFNCSFIPQASRPLAFSVMAANEHSDQVKAKIAGEASLIRYADKQEKAGMLMIEHPQDKRFLVLTGTERFYSARPDA